MTYAAYTFPATKWVEKDASIVNQAKSIEEEANEVYKAIWDFSFDGGSIEDVAIEAVDVIQSCETMLRILEEYHEVDIDAAVRAVYVKNDARGYYEAGGWES